MDIEQEDLEFDWEVIEIINVKKRRAARRGAMVRYTPCGEIDGCQTIEKFVPIPWHKCTCADHMKEIAQKKIIAYAPRRDWLKELIPAVPDKSEELIKEIQSEEPAKGSFRDGNPVEPAGSEGDVDVSEAPDATTR